MTYQAVQAGASQDVELKNRHVNPDLGVWNCHVPPASAATTTNAADGTTNQSSQQLVDSLLAKVAPQAAGYCLTVDLSDESKVEPSLSLLQSTLVRHLIENPPTPAAADPATEPTDAAADKITKTTNLYDLQSVQFGLASNDKATEQKIEEAAKDVVVSLMICAILPTEEDPAEVSEQAYKNKQARALVIYHLRKFANAINAALCFVRDEDSEQEQWQADLATASKESMAEVSVDQTATSTTAEDAQPAISYDMLSKVWCDLAMGIPVWQDESYSIVKESGVAAPDDASEAVVTTTALYGPGKQQEDLIESVLLRNANYPGHWEASKESLWVALPAPSEPAPPVNNTKTGDEGWLTQLRESIASALPAEKSAPKAEEDAGGKPKEKDAAVSSFFESLLKNP